MRETEEKAEQSHRAKTWRWLAVAAALIIALPAGILIRQKLQGSPAERGAWALVQAFKKQRLIEPRLSGGFLGGEFKRTPGDRSDVDAHELDRATDLIMDAAAKGDSSAELPYARLLLSKGEKLTEAQKYLRRVVARAPESAEAHNDLGVCFIQQGKVEDAIDEFEAALTRRPEMPEALFNRALSYQRLLLKDPALRDFKRVAEVERDKSWVNEINHRIEEVSRPPGRVNATADPITQFDTAFEAGRIDDARRIAKENSESLRRHALWDVTIQHLQKAVDGDTDGAQRALYEISLIGAVLIEAMKDSIADDVGRRLGSLADSDRGTELGLIREYVETSRRNKMTDETNAIFERLENEFRARGNQVFEALSCFRVADYYYESKLFKQSLEKLKKLLSSIESREWPFDRARFLNELALETSRLGQDSLAIKYFEKAISLCTESPELESRILQYMSVPYVRLGDIDGALERLRNSTRLIMENRQPQQTLLNLAYNYSQIAAIYSRRNQSALALLYADQALQYSEQAKKPEYAAEFSSSVAVENARLDQYEKAEADLKRAFEHLGAIGPGRVKDLTEARVLTNAIEVAGRNGDTKRALDYYARAESLATLDEGNALLKIDLLRARATAFAASGQSERARSDLARAVSEIERYRSSIETSDQRSHFLDASHSVYDQLISLDAGALNRAPEAFEMSERSRARALLEEISRSVKATEPQLAVGADSSRSKDSSTAVAPLALSDVQSKLPDDTTVLEYSVTSRGSYLFLITRSGLKVKESPATTEMLDRLTREYIGALRNLAAIEEVNEKGRELYDYLIKPVEKEIDGATNLYIVPDKALHFLPFAALVDASAQYLFKSHRLSYAPSASVLIRCFDEDATSTGKPEKIVAVGDPRFNSEAFPNLQPLADAEREADKSAQFYAPDSKTLVGARATEQLVRSAMRECDVAHLAVHCLVDDSSPWLAALVLADASQETASHATGAISVLAPTRSAALNSALPLSPAMDPNDGLLYLNELYGMKLPRTRLVVLSACQSGLGQYYRGEGIVSLVRPFLAAGAPTVVASLWPVDSKATSDLMIEFHRQRKLAVGINTAEALRKAQTELSRTYEHPFYWAPFIVVGGGAASR